MGLSDIIQIIIGILSLIATITVSFVIYWLQMHHEKEMQRLEQKQRQNELEERAKCFLIKHESEKNYLPWCILAANLHRLERHSRVIYADFCLCPVELRNEILKQAGFKISFIEEQSWVNICIEKLKADIQKYNLGRDYLYEGAKYFHRSFLCYRDLPWNGTPRIFKAINKDSYRSRVLHIDQLSIGEYIDEYFFWYIDKNMNFEQDIPIPPLDYVWNSQNLGYCTEKQVCMWMMDIMENIALVIGNRRNDYPESRYILEDTDAEAETYEDKYYKVLQALYNTYYGMSEDNRSRDNKVVSAFEAQRTTIDL